MTTTTDYVSRTLTFDFGGRDCCAKDAEYLITRTDATGTRRIRTCLAHRDEATHNAADYVGGWGDVSLTVRRITEDRPEESHPTTDLDALLGALALIANRDAGDLAGALAVGAEGMENPEVRMRVDYAVHTYYARRALAS